MTNDKAIKLLRRIADEQFDGQHGDERREALDMAVMALESNLVKESGNLVQDLVKDCISRKAAIDAFEPEHDTDWYTPQIIEVLEALPSAQPERKKGHWIRHITTGLGPKLNDTIECSECRIAFSTENMFRRSFCPNCGADMRGESDE